jgi:ABC-type branched-subunit amino acid transport system substrate-binding protein
MGRLVGALVPARGRYSVQGGQLRAGLELWARRAGAQLVVEDDESQPELAAVLFQQLVERGCEFVLGPYGSDSTRAVAEARRDAVVWNHGGAADDVQRLPGVISVPSPASRYLVALGSAIATLRPGAAVAVVTAPGCFARFARAGIERAAPSLGLTLAGAFSLRDPPAAVAAARPDAVFACGPPRREIELFGALREALPDALLGGVSPGLSAFPELLGADPKGFLAPVQWHPDVEMSPKLGPPSHEFVSAVAAAAYEEPDYIATQGYAAALIADHCLDLAPENPLSAAQRLRTTTMFGAFELDASGLQVGHRLAVIRWHQGKQELVT